MKDSAGIERTEDDVLKTARKTADQMGTWDLLDVLIEEMGGLDKLPGYFTRCPCHGLWYDHCAVYR